MGKGLTDKDLAWLNTKTSKGFTRRQVFFNASSQVKRDDGKHLSVTYTKSRKGLFDREADLLIEAIKKIASDFFEGMPRAAGQEKPIVGRMMLHFYNDGKSKHKKPNAKKGSGPLQQLLKSLA